MKEGGRIMHNYWLPTSQFFISGILLDFRSVKRSSLSLRP